MHVLHRVFVVMLFACLTLVSCKPELRLSPGQTARFNFQDEATPVPPGHYKDFGEPYGQRSTTDQGGLEYGWVAPGTSTPRSLLGLGKNRGMPADVRLATLVHMQPVDLPPGGTVPRVSADWEISIENGRYTVVASVGDAAFFDSVHGLSIEGVAAISGFRPRFSAPFQRAEVTVQVSDGALTVSATGTNTKLNYIEIRRADTSSASGLDARPASNAYFNLPASPDITPGPWTTSAAFPSATFPQLRFLGPTALIEAPRIRHLFVLERDGRMRAIDMADKALKPVIDIRAHTQGRQDCGLLGLAFHPEFGLATSPNRGYIYVHYAWIETPVLPPVPATTITESRLSRFTVDLQTLAADPASELVLIGQHDDHAWHQGGAMYFGADGFLYLTLGDEGGSRCQFGNCQRIDQDLFAGVLRIDVDRRGGTISHPIPRQPATGRTGNYYIPNDNPFVGRAGVLEEFYALGLRSPHTMSHDRSTGLTFIGDVGQSAREEINVLRRGANYQWPILEGTHRHLPDPSAILGTWTPPLLELDRTQSNALIGGFVYRGSLHPELFGKYIFGDYYYGTIWALTFEYDGTNVRVTNREQLLTALQGRNNTITALGTDSDGEIYVLTLTDAYQNIRRLVRQAATAVVPSRLSQVGVFTNTSTLTAAPGLIPYDVQSPLWSDGTYKRRWVSVPSGTTVGFNEHGAWQYPPGTVFVKHFDMALDERTPSVRRRLETRLLVAAPAGRYYGVTYKWNPEQTDALPLLGSLTERLTIRQLDGTLRQQDYFYPGPSDCLTCHNDNAGSVLGVRTAQLNGRYAYPQTGREANQLVTWSHIGMFQTPLSVAAISGYPSLAHLSDETRTVTDRVRSYWDSNCSMCHGVDPETRSAWDARYETPLEAQGVIYGTLIGEANYPAGSSVVTPNDLQRSVMWLRDGSLDPNLRMPPIGRNRVDAEYMALLERWIRSLPVTPPSP